MQFYKSFGKNTLFVIMTVFLKMKYLSRGLRYKPSTRGLIYQNYLITFYVSNKILRDYI